MEHDPEQLVQEVIGLANIDVNGARYIIFGVNLGTMEGSGIVGIAESAIADLKKAHRLISALIKPVLQLAFIFDKIDGKLVGALEIDGCDAAPYVVRRDYSKKLAGGQSWIREGSQLRGVDPIDLEQIRARVGRKQTWAVKIGFDDQPDCQLLELKIPDTSNPPSIQAKRQIKQTLDWKKKVKDTFGTITTRVSRLLHVRQHGIEAEFDPRGTNTLIDLQENSGNEFTEADAYFFFEEKALKLNLTICNKDEDGLEDVSIKLAFPRIQDFDVADRLYPGPEDKRTRLEIEMAGYPEVQRLKHGILARASLGYLAPNSPQQVFSCALRLAVGPTMRGKKVAIKYTLRAKNKQSPGRGRLKIKFGEVSAESN
ncbi:MAG: helix-turn-helix domain-containing protein [Woeseia sp.]